MANNLINGVPIDRGIYGPLSALSDSYIDRLENSLINELGKSLRLSLINDAMAVALPYAGEMAAVITLGTNLGIGYPPLSLDHLRIVEEVCYEQI